MGGDTISISPTKKFDADDQTAAVISGRGESSDCKSQTEYKSIGEIFRELSVCPKKQVGGFIGRMQDHINRKKRRKSTLRKIDEDIASTIETWYNNINRNAIEILCNYNLKKCLRDKEKPPYTDRDHDAISQAASEISPINEESGMIEDFANLVYLMGNLDENLEVADEHREALFNIMSQQGQQSEEHALWLQREVVKVLAEISNLGRDIPSLGQPSHEHVRTRPVQVQPAEVQPAEVQSDEVYEYQSFMLNVQRNNEQQRETSKSSRQA